MVASGDLKVDIELLKDLELQKSQRQWLYGA